MTYIPAKLRDLVRARAQNRCEYCHVSDDDSYMPYEVDHIYATKHGGETTDSNLCLSCWVCNRHRGTDLTSLDPLTGEITPLYHPRNDIWTDHFSLDGPYIRPLTAEARVTVQLLQLNRHERVDERRILIRLRRYP